MVASHSKAPGPPPPTPAPGPLYCMSCPHWGSRTLHPANWESQRLKGGHLIGKLASTDNPASSDEVLLELFHHSEIHMMGDRPWKFCHVVGAWDKPQAGVKGSKFGGRMGQDSPGSQGAQSGRVRSTASCSASRLEWEDKCYVPILTQE